jgi:ATP-dependent DNA helicase RecG
VLARITEVWVGIEDPDPTVDRKGIKHLQDNGIDVHMFDRDLQEMISDENTAFMAQAMARASADDGQREVTLSPLEEAAGSVDLSDLSDEALQAFCTRADIAHAVGSSEFVRRLAHMGLLTQDRGTYRPTGFGVVLFGREPRVTMPQTGLLATIRYDDGTEEPMAFEGPQVLAPEAILGWLRAKLPNPTVRSEARRRESNAAVFEILREAVVNALVHRDYGILGAKCQLTITPNEFVVRSPGSPVPPITLQQMQAFGAPMLSRNPVLHYVFAQMDLAEERGLGLRSIAKCAEQAGLPRPRYEFDAPYLVLTVFRSRAAATASLPDDAQAALSESMRPGWEWLSSNVRATSTQYAEAMGVDQRTARRHLEALMALGLVTKVGKTRGARYEVR